MEAMTRQDYNIAQLTELCHRSLVWSRTNEEIRALCGRILEGER